MIDEIAGVLDKQITSLGAILTMRSPRSKTRTTTRPSTPRPACSAPSPRRGPRRRPTHLRRHRRQSAYPASLLGHTPGQLINTGDERPNCKPPSRWDCTNAGRHPKPSSEHTIGSSGERANDAVVAAGRHLIAVEASLDHGQWATGWTPIPACPNQIPHEHRHDAEGQIRIISSLGITRPGPARRANTPDAAR